MKFALQGKKCCNGLTLLKKAQYRVSVAPPVHCVGYQIVRSGEFYLLGDGYQLSINYDILRNLRPFTIDTPVGHGIPEPWAARFLQAETDTLVFSTRLLDKRGAMCAKVAGRLETEHQVNGVVLQGYFITRAGKNTIDFARKHLLPFAH
jgi:hypothetical protein